MIRPTLAMVRSSALPARAGICAADISAVAAITNEAQERLLNDPLAPDEGYWGGWARMQFTVTPTNKYAYITTPRDVARLIVMDVCQTPIHIRNGFYEFLEFGIGLQPRPAQCGTTMVSQNCACGVMSQAYERDSVVTLSPQTISPAILRFYAGDTSDLGRRILVQGTDQNDKPVTSIDIATKQSILGEYVALALPFADTVNQFKTITGMIKDVTVGQVTIHQVSPVTGDELSLSLMETNEVTAQYRRYLLNGLPTACCSGPVQITAQAKLDFVPVMSDPDYLLIQSIPALIEEAQAIRYSSMDSPNAAKLEEKHHMRALQLLFGQIDHYLGKTQTAIRVPIFGSDRIRMQPL